jgi:hypothetical protein
MTTTGFVAFCRSVSGSPTVRVAQLVLILGFGQACTTWRTTPLTPENFPRRDSLRIVRVTLANGTRLNLQNAQITPDSLRGRDVRAERPLIVPLSGIERVQTSHFDGGKTVGLLLILGVVAGAAIGASIAGSVEN